MSLTQSERAILQYIKDKIDNKESVIINQEEMANSIGITRKTVTRTISKLKRENIIIICHNFRGPSSYQLL